MSTILNKRVKYNKSGSRKGWRGTITSVEGQRFTVSYDNGVIQDYLRDALYDPTERGQDEWYEGYIRIVSGKEPQQKTTQNTHTGVTSLPRFTKTSHLVVDLYTGEIISVEPDEQSATEFAIEEAKTNPHYRKYVVFKPSLVIGVKEPEIVTGVIDA